MDEEKAFRFKSDSERQKLIADYLKKGEVRCIHCGRLLFKGSLAPGSNVNPRCPRCKKDNEITVL